MNVVAPQLCMQSSRLLVNSARSCYRRTCFTGAVAVRLCELGQLVDAKCWASAGVPRAAGACAASGNQGDPSGHRGSDAARLGGDSPRDHALEAVPLPAHCPGKSFPAPVHCINLTPNVSQGVTAHGRPASAAYSRCPSLSRDCCP